jgi:hypothetical protein
MVLALGELLGHPWIGVLLSVSVMTAAGLWALQAWFPSRWALLGGILVFLRVAISSYWINSYWGSCCGNRRCAGLWGTAKDTARPPHTRCSHFGLGCEHPCEQPSIRGFHLLPSSVCVPLCLAMQPPRPFMATCHPPDRPSVFRSDVSVRVLHGLLQLPPDWPSLGFPIRS